MSESKIKGFWHDLIRPFEFGPPKAKDEEEWDEITAREQKRFPFKTLVAATRDFSPLHKLGDGGFGPMYRGRLDDGREVMVKRLLQSWNREKKEFTNEARLLVRVQHRNVVSLLGYCVHGSEKLLVYEYISNESLDGILFRSDGGRRGAFDWKGRYAVMLGVARGLLYMHEDSHECVIHLDIKARNVLVDSKWVPKITDFGMTRLFPEDQNTRVGGTDGYTAPEYVMRGQISKAADVFSFGVLMLEVVTGRRNNCESSDGGDESHNLLDWAYKMHKKGKTMEIVDPSVATSAVPEQALMCVQIGLLCTQGDPRLRPSMGRVVLLLGKKPVMLDEPIARPGIVGRTRYQARRHRGSSIVDGSLGTSATNTVGSRLIAGSMTGDAFPATFTQ